MVYLWVKGKKEKDLKTREIREQVKMYMKWFNQKWNSEASLGWPFENCLEQLISSTGEENKVEGLVKWFSHALLRPFSAEALLKLEILFKMPMLPLGTWAGGPRLCLSNQLPADAWAAGPLGTMLWVGRLLKM